MFGSKIYKEILQEYEEIRDNSKFLIEKKKETLYKKIPNLEEIENNLNITQIQIMKATFDSTIKNKKEYIKKLKETFENLDTKKKELLKINNIPKDYFTNIYNCQICKDKGFVDNQKCKCFKEKLIKKAYNVSNIHEFKNDENFSNFSLDYYSKDYNSTEKMSPYENMSIILKKSYLFVENFDTEFKNLIFYGNPGLGKTFLCKCIAREILNKGKFVFYLTAENLFKTIENEKFDKNFDNIAKEMIAYINDSDLLIIDDLGTEFISSVTSSSFFYIINNRILKNKSTIISTNLEPDSIMEHYSYRVLSRFYGEYDIIKFFGNDIRIIKKYNKTI